MKDFTDRRLGVWYPRKPFHFDGYDIVAKRWVRYVLNPGSHLVFLEDRHEGNNPGHIFYVNSTVCWHPRMNNARWNKKFER